MNYWGKHVTFSCFNVKGTGTKSLGFSLWGTSNSFGLELNFWVWEAQFIWEKDRSW